ncbi:hypothetical protein ES703_58830 [subsurface metagenome]
MYKSNDMLCPDNSMHPHHNYEWQQILNVLPHHPVFDSSVNKIFLSNKQTWNLLEKDHRVLRNPWQPYRNYEI